MNNKPNLIRLGRVETTALYQVGIDNGVKACVELNTTLERKKRNIQKGVYAVIHMVVHVIVGPSRPIFEMKAVVASSACLEN